jgi:hypothetical protein
VAPLIFNIFSHIKIFVSEKLIVTVITDISLRIFAKDKLAPFAFLRFSRSEAKNFTSYRNTIAKSLDPHFSPPFPS